jgi:hypothetical protein
MRGLILKKTGSNSKPGRRDVLVPIATFRGGSWDGVTRSRRCGSGLLPRSGPQLQGNNIADANSSYRDDREQELPPAWASPDTKLCRLSSLEQSVGVKFPSG